MTAASLSAAGLVGALITVTATTIDDAVWLIPFVGSSSHAVSARVAHAILFVGTLEFLSIGSVIVAWLVSHGVILGGVSTETQEIVLGSIAAVLCWVLAAFFFVKKWLKRRRRRQQHQQRQEETTALVTNNEINTGDDPENHNYQSTANDHNQEPQPQNKTSSSPKPFECGNIGTIMSLTFLGALDEVSYFPALIIGHIFTPLEVCLGTLLAAILILVLVTCCLARIQPLVDCLDRIPIYAVISLFAIILSVGVLYDILQSDDE